MSDTGADYVLVLESESLSIPIFGKWGRTAVLVITRKRGLSPFFLMTRLESDYRIDPALRKKWSISGLSHFSFL